MYLGDIDDPFTRHSFEVGNYLKKNNILRIELQSPSYFTEKRLRHLTYSSSDRPCSEVRKPRLMNLVDDADYPSISSIGIRKPVLLEFYEVAILRDVSVNVVPAENHWSLNIRLFLGFPIRFNFYAEATFMTT